jgi:hypothetical protein
MPTMLSFEKSSATTMNHNNLKGTPQSEGSFTSARDASAGYGYGDASPTETRGMKREAGSELIEISALNKCMSSQELKGFASPEAMVRKPPAATSAVIQQVKALSEKDFALLILQDGKVTAISILQDKREMRLSRVRDRIQKKKDKEAEDQLEEKMNSKSNLDMSDDARRDRAYAWYTRMAMPNRVDMKKRMNEMPSSAGIGIGDVDLLPWGASGKLVNIAKMQKFIHAGFKKKFTRKAKVGSAPAVSDSDSD